jgi:SAM-dependent methyltransferase
VDTDRWEWDDTLYAGSAAFYVQGRMSYPPDLRVALRDELHLDGTGRLLDVGCGPGSATLLLADLFSEVVGVDADAEMLVEAGRESERRGCENATWVHRRAEELPAGLGSFRVVVFAQSFHWMDRPRVAETVRAMLEPGGSLVHVGATTHRGVSGGDPLPAPRPPHDQIADLVRRYLGPVRRAGRGRLSSDTPSDEDEILAAAGFRGPRRVDVGGGRIVERSEDDIVASVHSLSSATPHLFGDRLEAFDAELRQLLRRVAPAGRFCERTREITLAMWDPSSTPTSSQDSRR